MVLFCSLAVGKEVYIVDLSIPWLMFQDPPTWLLLKCPRYRIDKGLAILGSPICGLGICSELSEHQFRRYGWVGSFIVTLSGVRLQYPVLCACL